MSLLSVTSIVAYRHGAPLFGPATFQLNRGDCLLISGGNGVGKTTLLDCVAGVYRDWSGRIEMQSDGVSYLQQAASYVRTLTLSRLARLVVGFDRVRYLRLLDSLRLNEHENTLLSLLSGGELQRARILLALLRRHSVLLLDEPFANVDLMSCEAIASELAETRSERATVIVTHPLEAYRVSIERSMTLVISQC